MVQLLFLAMLALPARCRANDSEVSARLAWIDRQLSAGAPGAALWWGGWSAYAAAEAAYGWTRYARVHDRLDRDLWLVTGLGSSLWLAQLMLFPINAAYAPRRMRRLERATAPERAASLPRAERLLARAAQAEREGLHWREHVLDLSWAFGSAAYIFGRNWGHASDRRVIRETSIELALTVLLSEAAILSTPRRALRDHTRYQQGWSVELGAASAAWTLHF